MDRWDRYWVGGAIKEATYEALPAGLRGAAHPRLVGFLSPHPGDRRGSWSPTRRSPHGPAPGDGQTGLALQTARLRLPVVRDLRRTWLGVGLRAARRRAQEERQG